MRNYRVIARHRGVADIADPLELYAWCVSCIYNLCVYIYIYNIYLYIYINIHLEWIYLFRICARIYVQIYPSKCTVR